MLLTRSQTFWTTATQRQSRCSGTTPSHAVPFHHSLPVLPGWRQYHVRGHMPRHTACMATDEEGGGSKLDTRAEEKEKNKEEDKAKSVDNGANGTPEGNKPEDKDEQERLLLSELYKKAQSTESTSSPIGFSSNPFELRRFLELLVEYGAQFGTAAVVIGFFTHIDPFGGFKWDMDAIKTGLLMFLPVLLLDCVLTLPDYSSSPEQAKDTMLLFIKPDLLAKLQEEQKKLDAEVAAEAATDPSGSQEKAAFEAATAAAAAAAAAVTEDGGTMEVDGSLYVSVNAIAQAEPMSPVEARGRKLKLALEMLQDYYMRNNPTGSMKPLAELFIILVSCLADEMLYRAVLLTLVSLWIRDRLYEAGADDVLSFGGLQLDVLQTGQWIALALGATGGVLAFALRAVREMALVEKAQEIAKQMAEMKKAERKPRALPGWEKPSSTKSEDKNSVRRLPPELVTEVAVQLGGSMGSLNATVWAMEGLREVMLVVASGASFILTGNLAASYTGGVVSQTVFSAFQRMMLARKIKRRKAQQLELMEKRRAMAAAAALAAVEQHAAEIKAKRQEQIQQREEQQQQQQQQADNLGVGHREGPSTSSSVVEGAAEASVVSGTGSADGSSSTQSGSHGASGDGTTGDAGDGAATSAEVEALAAAFDAEASAQGLREAEKHAKEQGDK